MNREERERLKGQLPRHEKPGLDIRPKGWDFFGVDSRASVSFTGSNYYTLVMTTPAWNGILMNWGDAPAPNHE